MALPISQAEWRGEIAVLRLARPEKRNALNDPTVEGIGEFFASLPSEVKAVVLDASGSERANWSDSHQIIRNRKTNHPGLAPMRMPNTRASWSDGTARCRSS